MQPQTVSTPAPHPAAAATAGQASAPTRAGRPPVDPHTGVGQLVAEAEGWFLQLKRTAAAYNSLYASLLSHNNQLPEGERKKGLPVFEFSASLEGRESREAVKCVADLKKVDPNFVGHVLIPLINAQAADLMEAVTEIGVRVELLKPLLAAIVGGPPQQQAA